MTTSTATITAQTLTDVADLAGVNGEARRWLLALANDFADLDHHQLRGDLNLRMAVATALRMASYQLTDTAGKTRVADLIATIDNIIRGA